jgi:hypothetical protein
MKKQNKKMMITMALVLFSSSLSAAMESSPTCVESDEGRIQIREGKPWGCTKGEWKKIPEELFGEWITATKNVDKSLCEALINDSSEAVGMLCGEEATLFGYQGGESECSLQSTASGLEILCRNGDVARLFHGEKGEPGDKGFQGDVGERGEQGDKGPVGDAGPMGEAGSKGPKGLRGMMGDGGPEGAAGDAGPQGEQGDAGTQGPKGPRGDDGARGLPGNPGPRGPQGPVGPMGPQGVQGAAGQC